MKIAVDTNVLVRILTHDNRQESDKAEELVRSNDIIITNQTLCELMWVLRRLYDFTADELVEVITRLSGTSNIAMDRAAASAGLRFLRAGGDFADGIIALEGHRQGSEIFATFDRKAASILRDAGQDCLLLTAN